MISGPGYNSKGTLEEEWVTENPRLVAGDTDVIGEGRAIQGKDRISVHINQCRVLKRAG